MAHLLCAYYAHKGFAVSGRYNVLEMGNEKLILISDYDPSWLAAFAKLAAKVMTDLGTLAVVIEHIGSTSVLGLAAKPIIDLGVIVAFRADIPEAIRVLATIGYMHPAISAWPAAKLSAHHRASRQSSN